ncbi:hypothetical protein, partial [Corynebacterium glutamicum]
VTKIINGTLLSSQTTYAHDKSINILFVGVLLAACSTLPLSLIRKQLALIPEEFWESVSVSISLAVKLGSLR